MTAPFSYQFENVYNSMRSPSTVHCKNTGLVNFFSRMLLNEALSVLTIDGTPDTFPEHYMEYSLFNFGFVSIIDTNKFGVIPQICSIYGYDVFYRPNRVLVSNPLLPTIDVQIGTECALIQLMPDYSGLLDVVTFYADMMALTAESAGINLINSKLSYVFTVDDKASAETAKKLYDNIASGMPAAFVGKSHLDKNSWNLFTQNVGQNYIADRNLVDLRNWHNQFLTYIGIPTANIDKKERLIKDEVNSNNVQTSALISVWLREIQRGLDVANRLFGLNMRVRYTFAEMGGDSGGKNDNIVYRSV